MAVDVAVDGTDALAHLALTRYDVVVLDRDLPGVHGDEVCRQIVAAGGEGGVEEWEPFDLAEITGNVVLARREDAEHRGIEISTALSAATARGDPRLAESLVVNLVDNAIRYNVTGGRVEISTVSIAGRATLRVGNTGAVIPPGQVGRLFEPFQRLSGQRTGNGDGYGLGLAIVRAIADAHGATVTPRARPEGGLDLEVSFPGKPVGALPGAVAASAGE